MDYDHLNRLIQNFNLGLTKREPKRVYGGLLHIMWRLDTNKGSYAIKPLSKDINLKNEKIIKNYELSEVVAEKFAMQGIPAICAIAQSGKYLFTIECTGYLVYPWVDAKHLDIDKVNIEQALEIASLLAKMHRMNLQIDGLDRPRFDTNDNKYIADLVKHANIIDIPFAESLNMYLPTILTSNAKYFDSIKLLNKQTVISHGDLDPKNVLWTDNNQPLLIDWESARKLNPTYEIVNAALDWSGVATNFNKELFRKMLYTYQQYGGIVDRCIVEAAFYGVIGNWINWMVYNINRSINSECLEQKRLGIEQVNQVLPTILRVENLKPDIVN